MWGIRLDVNLKGNFVVINKASLGISYILKLQKKIKIYCRLANTGVGILRYKMQIMLYPIMWSTVCNYLVAVLVMLGEK